MRTLIMDAAEITARVTIRRATLPADHAVVSELASLGKDLSTRIRSARVLLKWIRRFSSLTARISRALIRVVSSERRQRKQQEQYR